MAKRRRVNLKASQDRPKANPSSGLDLETSSSNQSHFQMRRCDLFKASSLAIMFGLLTYVAYHPSDSIAVEQGDALWLGLTSILVFIGCSSWKRERISSNQMAELTRITDLDWSKLGLNYLPWLLAAWMMASAIYTSPPGNLRVATNEAWLWLSAACLLSCSRNLLLTTASRRVLLTVLLVTASGMAIQGMHQHLISLPANRAEYQRDPDAVLALAGIDAPAGSTERMVFENRLMDGGPTGTFALANSLAGYLLMGFVLALGLACFRWAQFSTTQRATLLGITALCFCCLIATRSRTATLTMLLASVAILISATGVLHASRKWLVTGLSALATLSVAGIGFLAVFGNREWFEQAPASLAFRFQYWRSTWQLAMDYPIFGAGPGNFQSLYERYREPSATEQIAEPHHFLMETLAAGGFPAVAMVLLMGIAAVVQITRKTRQDKLTAAVEQRGTKDGTWASRGAIVGFLSVWILGLISLELPDPVAGFFAIPIAIGFCWLLIPTLKKCRDRELDLSLCIVLAALLIHLSVSGGWTVPGMAVWIWIGIGALTRTDPHAINIEQNISVIPLPFSKRSLQTIGVVIGFGLLGSIWVSAWRPVQRRQAQLTQVVNAQQRGDRQSAERLLQVAMETDQLSPEPALWLADLYRWELVLASKSPTDSERNDWLDTVTELRARAGEDPSIERMIGGQAMHLFQRHGQKRDLEIARNAFQSALDWSPSSEWLHAQASVIAKKVNLNQDAAILRKRAEELSRLGGNIERDLSKKMIYIPTFLGGSVQTGPSRASAASLLIEPNR